MEDRPCTILDPSGDVRLTTNTQDFVVSSKVLCLASPVWRAMFDRQGHWARQSSSSSSSSSGGIFDLPEDDPNALLIISRIAYLRFSEVPDTVVYQHLLQLAVLCDKYNTVQLVRPWILEWQAPLLAQVEESCRKGGEGYEGYETWLFIAWAFGDEAVFRTLSRSLVLTSTVSTVDGQNRLVNPQGDMVGDTMPPGSVEAIIEARSERISALLEMCYELVDQYEATTLGGTTMCTRSQSSKECDSLVYGCLIRGLQNLNLYPKRVKASEVKSSVTAFANKLRSLDCFTYPQSNSNHSNSYLGYREYDDDEASHSDCSFTLAFAVQVNAIIDQKEALGVLEAHLTHVGEQKKK